jgi:hypothetical protein
MKKKLYVPHPGHFDGLKELVSEAGKDIYSIFMAGSPDYVGTGRSNISSPQIEDIREQTLCAQEWREGGDRAEQFMHGRAPTDTRGKACRTG